MLLQHGMAAPADLRIGLPNSGCQARPLLPKLRCCAFLNAAFWNCRSPSDLRKPAVIHRIATAIGLDGRVRAAGDGVRQQDGGRHFLTVQLPRKDNRSFLSGRHIRAAGGGVRRQDGGRDLESIRKFSKRNGSAMSRCGQTCTGSQCRGATVRRRQRSSRRQGVCRRRRPHAPPASAAPKTPSRALTAPRSACPPPTGAHWHSPWISERDSAHEHGFVCANTHEAGQETVFEATLAVCRALTDALI